MSSWTEESVGEELCHDAAHNGQVEEDVGVADSVDLGEEVGSTVQFFHGETNREDGACNAQDNGCKTRQKQES